MVMVHRWQIRLNLFLLALLALLLTGITVGCAFSAKSLPKSENDIDEKSSSHPNLDTRLAEWIRKSQPDSALIKANQLIKSTLRKDKIIGTYWRGISLIQLGHLDSARTLFGFYRGKWGNASREAHAETLMSLLEEKGPKPCSTPVGAQRAETTRLEGLERQNQGLLAEVEKLQMEKSRYERLLRELDRLP